MNCMFKKQNGLLKIADLCTSKGIIKMIFRGI